MKMGEEALRLMKGLVRLDAAEGVVAPLLRLDVAMLARNIGEASGGDIRGEAVVAPLESLAPAGVVARC